MKKFFSDNFLYIYLIVVAGDLLGDVFGSFVLNLVFKPLIVSSLLVYLVTTPKPGRRGFPYAMAGLLFSWMGDCLLIFQSLKPLYFILGLLAFLVAHIFYIVYYIRSAELKRENKFRGQIVFILLFLCYGLGFGWLLNSHLGPLKVPVFAYAGVLILMNIFALNRFGKVDRKGFQLVMAGAMLFAVSDGLLAINKFVTLLPLAGLAIMSTYAAAQYLIAKSIFTSDISND
jgi:uncharacterized membrane protein YhhN